MDSKYNNALLEQATALASFDKASQAKQVFDRIQVVPSGYPFTILTYTEFTIKEENKYRALYQLTTERIMMLESNLSIFSFLII